MWTKTDCDELKG